MLKGMEDSVLGIWVAHGEGRAFFPDRNILQKINDDNLAPPKGSANSIASLCSPDGRHLAIMPHPERTFLKWHWPWMPEKWKQELKASPWLKMFQNAREWCEESKDRSQ